MSFCLFEIGTKLEDEHLFPCLTLWADEGFLANYTMRNSLLRTDFTFPGVCCLAVDPSGNKFGCREFQGTSSILIAKKKKKMHFNVTLGFVVTVLGLSQFLIF